VRREEVRRAVQALQGGAWTETCGEIFELGRRADRIRVAGDEQERPRAGREEIASHANAARASSRSPSPPV
jgi:hypothetical protein